MINRGTRAIIAAIILCAVAVPAHSLVEFDFEQRYLVDPPEPILDHSMVLKDGVYHLFYLRGNPAVSIGHATSTDLVHWNLETPVLEPGPWDDRAMWAPHVFEPQPGTYYMFYTGVNLAWSQQSGLAISNDLGDWFKLSWPLYNPDPSWALWSESEFSHGRDPHVLEWNGKYYMFVTAKTLGGLGAVACAESDDLINWTDIGPIYVHPNWHVLESVFIKERNGKFHMFFTEQEVFGTSHIWSDNLLSGWDLTTRTYLDPGHAPQIFEAPDGTEIFSRHNVHNVMGNYTYTIRLDPLIWVDPETPFVPTTWALEDDWEIVSGDAFSIQPVFGNNPAARGVNIDPNHEDLCWIGTYERYTGPMGQGFAGGVQGDGKTGVIRSYTFRITGTTMQLRVGGSDLPGECYVALVNSSTGQPLFSETGRDTDEMDVRTWDLTSHIGKYAYVEIADLSASGHINVDHIEEMGDAESSDVGEEAEDGTIGLPRRSPGAPAGDAALHQNVPNPFNPVTLISFEVPSAGHVRLEVFDAHGQLVRRVADARKPAGVHALEWDGRDATGAQSASGVYFYRLIFNGNTVDTKKMVLLK